MWEQRVTLGSVEITLIIESECSLLLRVNAVAGFLGFGMGVGGVGPWVNIFSVTFSVFYVHFVFSCMLFAVALDRPTQLSQVLCLSYLVLEGEQVELFLMDQSIIGGVTHPHHHSIT